MKDKKIMKRGFSLMELAIVLVIIGVISGGILIARGMQTTSRINSQIQQFQQLDIATVTFRDQYKQLPGDCTACGAGVISGVFAGDGNGKLEGNWRHDPTYPGEAMWVEPYFYFIHLSIMGGLIPGSYNYAENHEMWGPGNQVPAAAIGRGGIMAEGNNFGDVYYTFQSEQSTTGLAGYTWIMPHGNISAEEALAIDKKMDDGFPYTGNMAATTNIYAGDTSQIPLALDTVSGGCVNTVKSTYNVSNPSKQACTVVIKANIQ